MSSGALLFFLLFTGATRAAEPLEDAPPPPPAETDTAPDEQPDRDGFDIRYTMAAIGGVGGGTWWRNGVRYDLLTGDGHVDWSFSPLACAGLAVGWPHVQIFAGLETAPFFTYVFQEDVVYRTLFAYTTSLSFGGERVQMGPYITAGMWSWAYGLRGNLWWWGHTEYRGLELRAGLLPYHAFQAALMYVWQG